MCASTPPKSQTPPASPTAGASGRTAAPLRTCRRCRSISFSIVADGRPQGARRSGRRARLRSFGLPALAGAAAAAARHPDLRRERPGRVGPRHRREVPRPRPRHAPALQRAADLPPADGAPDRPGARRRLSAEAVADRRRPRRHRRPPAPCRRQGEGGRRIRPATGRAARISRSQTEGGSGRGGGRRALPPRRGDRRGGWGGSTVPRLSWTLPVAVKLLHRSFT